MNKRTSLCMVAVSFAAAVVHAAPLAQMPGFPTENAKPSTATGVLAADLTGKGTLDIVVTMAESVVIMDASGKIRPNFPVQLHDDTVDQVSLQFQATPTACDLNGDGTLEVIVAGSNKRLYALTTGGTAAPGFPVLLNGVARGPLTCLPVGSGKAHDLLFSTDAGSLMRLGGGGGVPQLVASIGEGAESGVALGDLDGDGGVDLVVGGGDSKVYAFDLQGTKRPGFPYKMSFRSTGVPALGDINDDGSLDIIVGSEDYKIHAINKSGEPLPGYPVTTGYRLYAGVCLGDIDNDGVVDVVAGSGDSKLYALNGQGKALGGFPVKLDGRLTTGCTVGDVDRDGRLEIGIVSQNGLLHLIDPAGKEKAGFPMHLHGKVEIAPALADLDNDGHPEVIAQDKTGNVQALRVDAVDTVPKALVPWGMVGQNSQHGGRLHPTPGRFHDLGWVNAKPYTTDPLKVHYRFFDLDGDKEQATQIRWYLGDAHQADLDNQPEVPASRTTKHQKWRYTLQEGDNFATFGETSILSYVFHGPVVEIRNTAPTHPAISLTPQSPRKTSNLQVQVVQPSVDADGDPLEYRFFWLKDNRGITVPTATTQIESARIRKNETWRVVALAWDGEIEGARSSAAVTVRNTPPGAPQLTFAPASPRIDDPVAITIAVPAHDDDSDALTYRYRYWVNEAPFDLAEATATVPARALHKHDKVRVEVTSVDDEETGGHSELAFVVQNTPPPPPALAIWPSHPRTQDDLVLSVVKQQRDTDADPIVLRHQWSVDGAKVDHPPVVPASDTRKGQLWHLDVTPWDGEAVGASVSLETRIENTPPQPPVMVLDHYTLTTDETVTPQVFVAATDADGDAVRLKYRWEKNGHPLKAPEDRATLAPDDTTKHDAWTLVVTPFDGEVDGASSRLPFTIINSPPSMPSVALSVPEPTVTDIQVVRVAQAATDKDGDSLAYHYRWYRDGRAEESWPANQNTLKPMQAHRGEHWRVEVRAFDGEVEGQPGTAEFRIANHAPAPPQVEVHPSAPRTDDVLSCDIKVPGTDADGDALTYAIRWLADGAVVDLARDANTVPAELTHQTQHWECEVRSNDGLDVSTPARSAPVVIGNTPPSAPVVTIAPPMPRTGQELVCGLATPSSDADQDPVTYTFSWQVDGKPVASTATAPNRIAASQTARGQNWECTVVPGDGKAKGLAARAVVTVQNTAPGAAQVSITPDRPGAGANLRCEILEPAHDIDGDKVTYRFAWSKDGVVQSFAPTSAEVPGRLVKLKDLWSCVATAIDPAGASGPAVSSQDVVVLDPPQDR